MQNRNGILHINILDYMTEGKEFSWVKELLIVGYKEYIEKGKKNKGYSAYII